MPSFEQRSIFDANLIATGVLPNGAATTYTPDLDLGAAGFGHAELSPIEVQIFLPLLTTGELPDTRTLTVTLMQGATASPTTPNSAPRVITGAGGVGAAKTYFRFKPSALGGRFIRAQFVGGTSAGNMSAKSGTVALVF